MGSHKLMQNIRQHDLMRIVQMCVCKHRYELEKVPNMLYRGAFLCTCLVH